MTRLVVPPTLIGLALAAMILAAGCGEESGSAQCPADELELYDIRDGGAMDPDVAIRLAEAGCVTLPAPSNPRPQPAAAGAGND